MTDQYYESPHLWEADRYSVADETRRFEAAADLLDHSHRSVLDVGTGNGEFLAILARQTPRSLAGLERSSEALNQRVAVPKALWTRGDASLLPFPDAAFDVVAALEVIEHLPLLAYEHTLKELTRVARSTVVLTVPYRERRLFIRCPECATRFQPNQHLRVFDDAKIRHLFDGLGFGLTRRTVVSRYAARGWWTGLKNALSLVPYPAGPVCPACGFQRKATNHFGSPGTVRVPGSLRWITHSTRPVWLAARFDRAFAEPGPLS